ncbi:MAG: hypothetical protein WA766_10060 [Candidatus Acidiferrales bacterium]|jgi:hypothetical protein
MAKTKARKKKPSKKPVKKAPPKKSVLKKSAKKAAPKKPARKKVVARAATAKKAPARRDKRASGKLYGMGGIGIVPRRDDHSETGGQSGDDQGLSKRESADSESVEELEDEGQSFEAEVIDGVENAPDPDVSEVKTHEVPEDDVPSEYDEKQSDV